MKCDRIDIYLYTYLEINKSEFVRSNMSFYEIETRVLKSAYSDASGDNPIRSPIPADSKGRFPKIFIKKPYSVVIAGWNGLELFNDKYE